MSSQLSIGILTLSASDNCGSLLQAYALERLLAERYAAQAQMIRFESKQSRELYRAVPSHPLRYPRKAAHGILHYAKIRQEKADYDAFRKKHLHLTGEKYHTSAELASITDFDTIVTGSDQVWNIRMPDYDEAFFLEWVPNGVRKVAYGPSLGGTDFSSAPEAEKLSQELGSFAALSVRERFGQQAVKALTGQTVPVVADPTLLLERSKWESLVPEPMVQGEYIFFYSWAYENETSNRLVEEYARKTGLPVYVINPSKWIRFSPRRFGFRLAAQNGPLAFLNLMRYAKTVFVQSFHGIIFADIFGKDFFFLDEHESNDCLDTRIREVLALLECEGRVARSMADIQENALEFTPPTGENLRRLRESSLAYLDSLFSSAADAAGAP